MKKFEMIQQEVLSSNTKTQLVSAGAGSGKTTVMIEKIFNLLTKDNVDLDNILVVTFTVLASSEMKERLHKSIINELQTTQNKEILYKLLDKLDTASIDTIDGFASKTIKKYFYELNISPNIEIISDTTRDYYLSKAMNKTINEFSHNKESSNLFLDFFGGNRRNFEPIKEMILSSYYNLMNIEDYEDFLLASCDEYSEGMTSEKVINDYICSGVKNLKQVIIENYSSLCDDTKKVIDILLNQIENFDCNLSLKTNLNTMKNFISPTFSRTDKSEELKEIKSKLSDFLEIVAELNKNKIDENFDKFNEKIVKYYAIFNNLLKEFIKNYNHLKNQNNLIDFSDLNRLMLKLLQKDSIKQELQEKYKYIFIDEYQDVNPLQDKLMTSLIGKDTKLFMVGDVKQSIYGFRGSSPEWFLKKYDETKKDSSHGDVFDMNINFRSNPKILSFINQIFSKLMTKELTGIDYETDCLIDPKREDIIDDNPQILLVKKEQDKTIANGVYSVKNDEFVLSDSGLKECMLVLKTITDLVGKEFYDANERTYRKLTYKDIAILSRAEKDKACTQLIEFLRANHVPINNNNLLDIHSGEGIKLILSILKCVNFTGDDVDYTATFLALSKMTIDDLIKLRNNEKTLYENLLDNIENQQVKEGFEIIEKIRNATATKSNKQLIEFILNECGIKYFLFCKPQGEREYRLLQEFIAKISPLENSLNLAEFIFIIENSVANGSDFELTDSEDSVTIQTIHKSKGLEYPVVILFNCDKIFTYITEHDAITFNKDIGFGIDYFEPKTRTKYLSIPKYAIKVKNKLKGYLEELRLLYVAMTRAKNKLIITGKYSSNFFDKIDDMKKTNYQNMILSVFAEKLIEGRNQFKYCDINFIDDIEKIIIPSKNQGKIEFVGENFVYPYENKSNISLKNSVTGLNSKKSEEIKFSTKENLTTFAQYDSEDRILKGVHYHKALEMLDLNKEYEKNTDFDDVDYEKIRLAHEILSKLTVGAISIKKEADFMMYLPYNKLVADSEITDNVLVQGVVDLLIEKEDEIILVDYKFSRLPIKILKEKYMEQLNLYKKAIEYAFKKPVEHMYIYSIETGELN